MKIAVVMDPIAQIKPYKDSTLAMLRAAAKRQYSLTYFTQADLLIKQGRAYGWARSLRVTPAGDSSPQFYQLGEAQLTELSQYDVILMRCDPPVNAEYLYTTYILDHAQRSGVLVVNDPASLRNHNEKLFATEFAQFTPDHLVTRCMQAIRQYHQQYQDIILKPLDGMGGASIFRLQANDPNASVIIETLSAHGQQQVMAQRYLPAIAQGDKRILLINGQPVDHCLARVPQPGETRGNLDAGGQGEVRPLSAHDRRIAETVGAVLVQRGILFAGIDVIGEHLTEINITSPTCMVELSQGMAVDIADQLIQAIVDQLTA